MKSYLLIISICLIATGCASVSPLPIPIIPKIESEFKNIEMGKAEATFALSKIVQNIDRGEKVMAFPSIGKYLGDGAYCNYRGAADYTYVGGKQRLGNWST
jgi:hypothetical protein